MAGPNTHTLSVLVQNKPGVLARIAGLISRRGYNIESLAVGPTESPEMSRMTLQVNVEDVVLEQITKQLNKLIEVLKIVELEETAVRRELVLVKVRATAETRSQLIEIIGLFGAKAVDLTAEIITVEATGSPPKLAALLDLLEPYGIRELVQSGLVALGRGNRSLTDRNQRTERLKAVRTGEMRPEPVEGRLLDRDRHAVISPSTHSPKGERLQCQQRCFTTETPTFH